MRSLSLGLGQVHCVPMTACLASDVSFLPPQRQTGCTYSQNGNGAAVDSSGPGLVACNKGPSLQETRQSYKQSWKQLGKNRGISRHLSSKLMKRSGGLRSVTMSP